MVNVQIIKTLSIALSIALSIVMSSAFVAHAQYHGVVKDFHTGWTLPGVDVKIKGTDKQTTTDSTGKYQFGSIGVEISKELKNQIRLQNGVIVQQKAVSSPVQIFDNSGRKITEIKGEKRGNETHFHLPHLVFGNYVAMVPLAQGYVRIPFFTKNGSLSSHSLRNNSRPLAKFQGSNKTMDISAPLQMDTLMFTKPGYVTQKKAVSTGSAEVNTGMIQLKFAGMKKIPSGKLGENPVRNIFMDSVEITRTGYNLVMLQTIPLKKSGINPDLIDLDQNLPVIGPGNNLGLELGDGFVMPGDNVTILVDFHPRDSISWVDAVLYCNKRSKNLDLDTCYSYTNITDEGVLEGFKYDSTT